MPGRLVLVKHSHVDVIPGTPARTWRLSATVHWKWMWQPVVDTLGRDVLQTKSRKSYAPS